MQANTEQPSLGDIETALDEGVNGADTQRAAYLGDFQRLRTARANVQEREAARLTAKYGAGHPRVLALQNRRAVNAALLLEVVQERRRAAVAAPDVDDNAWLVYGFVRDKNQQGVPHLTVACYGTQGRWLESLGFACTNEDGSFSLTTANVPPARAAVGLRLLRDGKAIYADPRPLFPALGRADYREIILGNDAAVCAPPESSGGPDPGLGGDTQPGIAPDPKAWIVYGRITGAQGSGLAGLHVTVYDKDLIFEDKLGQAVTDEQGNYVLTYHKRDFRALFESNPDLYLKVTDKQGKRLGNTKDAVRCKAGTVEEINLTLRL